MKPKLGTSVTALSLYATIVMATVSMLSWAACYGASAEERVVRIVVLGDTLIENKGVPPHPSF
jgi:hypothetical protein